MMRATTATATTSARQTALSRSVNPLLQSKCACGGSAGFSGQCEECTKDRPGGQRRPAGPGAGIAPPIVHAVLNSPGQPLDPATRAFMEPRFGHDFSRVRVHADQQAARSAQAVNASAYTVGRDMAFATGHYAPHTNQGRKLLAHELTHVVQQSSCTVGTSGIAAELPTNAAEREAETSADGIAAGVLSVPVRVRQSVPAVSRSLVGALAGGAMGRVLGGLFGPLGTVLGTAIGASLGDKGTTRRRPLTAAEKDYARQTFADAVDYDVIEITRGNIAATLSAVTLRNSINLQRRDFIDDTMELSDEGKLTLIHEMGHVWQYQHGGLEYIPSSLFAQAKAFLTTGKRSNAYRWWRAVEAGIPWEKWNPEQQAQCIGDYNWALQPTDPERDKDGKEKRQKEQIILHAQPYIEKMRRGEGAPGGKRKKSIAAPVETGAG